MGGNAHDRLITLSPLHDSIIRHTGTPTPTDPNPPSLIGRGRLFRQIIISALMHYKCDTCFELVPRLEAGAHPLPSQRERERDRGRGVQCAVEISANCPHHQNHLFYYSTPNRWETATPLLTRTRTRRPIRRLVNSEKNEE